MIENDTYRFLRALVNGKPYFGVRMASGQGDPTRHRYMRALVHLLASEGHAPLNILEIGSWAGGSAITWATALAEAGVPGRVYCVDHWKQTFDLRVNEAPIYSEMIRAVSTQTIERLFLHNIEAAGVEDRITTLRGSSAEILPTLSSSVFALVFVDGSHLYGDVATDLGNAGPLLSEGGILCGDDLELQCDECDPVVMADAIRRCMDYVQDPNTSKHYHPGVTAAVRDVLGSASSWEGFWAVRRTRTQWSPVAISTIPSDIPRHLEDRDDASVVSVHEHAGFSILESSQGAIALRAGLEPEALLCIPQALWRTLPLIVTGTDVEDVRQRLATMPTEPSSGKTGSNSPFLLRVGYNGFNIVRYGGRYYGVSQALGTTDLTTADLMSLAESDSLVAGDTERNVVLMVDGLCARQLRERVHELKAALDRVLRPERDTSCDSSTRQENRTSPLGLQSTQRTVEPLIETELLRLRARLADETAALASASSENAELRSWIAELHLRLAEVKSSKSGAFWRR